MCLHELEVYDCEHMQICPHQWPLVGRIGLNLADGKSVQSFQLVTDGILIKKGRFSRWTTGSFGERPSLCFEGVTNRDSRGRRYIGGKSSTPTVSVPPTQAIYVSSRRGLLIGVQPPDHDAHFTLLFFCISPVLGPEVLESWT